MDHDEHFSITLHGSIEDVSALHAAAVASYLAGTPNASLDEVHEIIGKPEEPDVRACIVMLLDPGMSPSGLELIDSDCETY